MTDSLPVHVSKEALHSLKVPEAFEATGSFDVRIRNHGQALHVHLHLDDTLSQIATLGETNHYVAGETEQAIRITVDTSRLDGQTVTGKLKVASGYGAETRWVDVEVSEPDPSEETVEVDESLAEPQPEPAEETSPALLQRPAVPVLALGLVAVFVALGAAALIREPVVTAGSVVLLAGVLVALLFLLRSR